MSGGFLSTAERDKIALLRGHVPDELLDRVERAYEEVDRINAIASEIPGGRIEPRHRVPYAAAALDDAVLALAEIDRYLEPRRLRFLRRIGLRRR